MRELLPEKRSIIPTFKNASRVILEAAQPSHCKTLEIILSISAHIIKNVERNRTQNDIENAKKLIARRREEDSNRKINVSMETVGVYSNLS